MKRIIFVLSLILLAGSVSSTIATYQGSEVKKGPEAQFGIGLGSNQTLNITLDVENKKGLNISYRRNFIFNPEKTESQIINSGENLPSDEIIINVRSDNPLKRTYRIPVVLNLNPISYESGEVASDVAYEREYTFIYKANFESGFGWEGKIPDKNNLDEANNTEGDSNNLDSENSLNQDDNNLSENEPKNPENNSFNEITILLIISLISISLYIIKVL